MVVDPSIPEEFESQFQKEHVCKIGIFDRNFQFVKAFLVIKLAIQDL